MLLTVVAAVVVLGVLIFVHELGHFWAAKAVGIGVPRFSIGFGPRTPVRWKRGETEYVLSWIPFGGYVKMASAEEADAQGALEGGAAEQEFPPDRLFENKPLWARIVVISAGVTMNALFAWFAYSMLAATYGRVEDPTTRIAAVDTTGLPESAREFATLPFGAEVVRINGDTVDSWNDIAEAVIDPRRDTLTFEFAGGIGALRAPIPGTDTETRVALLSSLHRLWEPRVGYLVPGRPAAAAGMAPGDLIVAADGAPVRYWDEFVRAIEPHAGDSVTLTVRRGDALVEFAVVPEPERVSGEGGERIVGRIGVGQGGFEPRRVRYGPLGAVVEGGRQTLADAGKVWFALKGLVVGDLPLRELGGPVLIGQLSGQFARIGFDAFVSFIAFFSVNLAILNLLPVPVLDGGHLVFLIAEGIRGKPLSTALRLRMSQVGMALLIALMVLALSNDVRRLIAS